MSGMSCAPPKCTARILGSRRRLSLGCCACRRWRTIDVGGVDVAQRGVRKFMFGAGEEQTASHDPTALARRNRRTLGEFQSSLHRSLTITQPTPEATPSRIAAVQGKLAARITRCRCRRAHRAS